MVVSDTYSDILNLGCYIKKQYIYIMSVAEVENVEMDG